MRRSYLELVFRHRLLMTVPMVLALVLGAGWGLSQPRSYVAGASLWTDVPIPNDSTVGVAISNGAPPSAGQQGLLTELLATRAFLLAVAADSPLAAHVAGRPPKDVNHVLAAMAASITVSTPGPQVVAISVQDIRPQHATGIAQALVRQYLAAYNSRVERRANAQLAFDSQQLAVATQALARARAELQRYARAHPEAAASVSDGTMAQLTTAAATAQQQQAEAAQAVSKDRAALAHAGDASVVDVIDQPVIAHPQGRIKTVLIGGIGGLLAGGTIAVFTLLLLMARDTTVRSEAELAALGMPVVATLGRLPGDRRPARRKTGPARGGSRRGRVGRRPDIDRASPQVEATA